MSTLSGRDQAELEAHAAMVAAQEAEWQAMLARDAAEMALTLARAKTDGARVAWWRSHPCPVCSAAPFDPCNISVRNPGQHHAARVALLGQSATPGPTTPEEAP